MRLLYPGKSVNVWNLLSELGIFCSSCRHSSEPFQIYDGRLAVTCSLEGKDTEPFFMGEGDDASHCVFGTRFACPLWEEKESEVA